MWRPLIRRSFFHKYKHAKGARLSLSLGRKWGVYLPCREVISSNVVYSVFQKFFFILCQC